MGAVEAIGRARSLLFVPGDRPERFDKAHAAGPDLVVVDLEDAVAAEAKIAARQNLEKLSPDRPVVIRINSRSTPWFGDDLAACQGSAAVMAIMLPKACAADLNDFGKPVIALIESAQGLADLSAVAGHPSVARLALGGIDLALDLGLSADGDLLDPFRLQMTLASRLAELPAPIDGVTTALADDAPTARDVAHAKALGFTGKLCIHPRQVEVVHRGLAPSEQEIAWAEAVLQAGSGGAAKLGGQMIDKPVVDRARRILASRA